MTGSELSGVVKVTVGELSGILLRVTQIKHKLQRAFYVRFNKLNLPDILKTDMIIIIDLVLRCTDISATL